MGKRRFLARVLDNPTLRRVAPDTWVRWLQTTRVYRGIGYRAPPPESGDLLVQSPYADWYNLTWGLAPNQDMPKWRWMYRSRPEVRRGVDTKVILAVGRGFSVVCEPDQEIEVYVNRLLSHLNIRDILQSAVTDMLIYGQAYFEKVRAIGEEEQEHERLELAPIEKRQQANVTKRWTDAEMEEPKKSTFEAWVKDANKVDRWLAQREPREEIQNNGGELVELKPLDPLWMRINRDAFGNITGFVQWGLTPIPQSIPADKIVFLRWMPKSWAHENAYGTSILMPIQRHISLLIQAEEDMKVYWHQYAKPMLVVKGGTQEKPYPLPRLKALQTSFAGRQPNTDAIVPGDTSVEVMKAGTGETTATFESWSRYLREKTYESIGIPSVLMNLTDTANRASNDISLQGFIAEEIMTQEIVGEAFLKNLIMPEVLRKFPDRVEQAASIKVVWPPVLEEDRNRKADRLVKMTGRPTITVNEARSELGFPPVEGEEYDEIAEQAVPGPASQASIPEESESLRTGPREEELQKRDRLGATRKAKKASTD